MSSGIVTFDNPCYLISGNGNDWRVEVHIVNIGGKEWVELQTTTFKEINGLCTAIRCYLAPAKPAYYGPTTGVTISPDAFGIIQPIPGVNGFTLSASEAGKPLHVEFAPIPEPVDLVDPGEDSVAPATLPEAKVVIKGGTISNGVEKSLLYLFYTSNGVPLRSRAIAFGKSSNVLGSDLLTEVKITAFEIHNPADSGPELFTTLGTVTLEKGICAVIMAKPLIPPTNTIAIVGIEYYLAEMVKEGPVGTSNLVGVKK